MKIVNLWSKINPRIKIEWANTPTVQGRLLRVDAPDPNTMISIRIKSDTSNTSSSEKMSLEMIDKEISTLIFYIVKSYPYIGLPYIYLGRAYTSKGTVAITGNGWLVVNPAHWQKLSTEEKFFTLIHEILHGLLKHAIRIPRGFARQWNIICDAIVNTFALNTLVQLNVRTFRHFNNIEEAKEYLEKVSNRNLVTWADVAEMLKSVDVEPPENLEKLSADEIFTLFYHGTIKHSKKLQTLKRSNSGSGGGCCSRSQQKQNQNQKGQGGGQNQQNQQKQQKQQKQGQKQSGNNQEQQTGQTRKTTQPTSQQSQNQNEQQGQQGQSEGGQDKKRHSYSGRNGPQNDRYNQGQQNNQTQGQGGVQSHQNHQNQQKQGQNQSQTQRQGQGKEQNQQKNSSSGRSAPRRRFSGRSMIQNDRRTPQNNQRGQGQGQCQNPGQMPGNSQGGNQGQNQGQGSNQGDTRGSGVVNGPIGGDLIDNYDPHKDDATVMKNRHTIFENTDNNPTVANNAWRSVHENAKNLHKTFQSTNKMAGHGAGIIDEIIELIDGESVVPWKKVLKDAIVEHYRGFTDKSFKKENRRYASMQRIHEKSRLYLPGTVRYNIPDIHITFDTSGSMSDEELEQIIKETYTIAKKYKTKIRITQWDYDIQDDRIITRPEQLKVFHVRGRGGTSIMPVLEYMAHKRKYNGKHYDLQHHAILIVFSDFELTDNSSDVYEIMNLLKKKHSVRFIFVNTKNFHVYDDKRHGLKKALMMALHAE